MLTHTHPIGIDGARLFAVAAAMAVRNALFDARHFYGELQRRAATVEFRDALEWAMGITIDDYIEALGASVKAHGSVPTAIACFVGFPNSYSDAVGRAVGLGGDVDTMAAMTGAAGAGLGIAAVPHHLLELLEEGAKGRSYLDQLAAHLHGLRGMPEVFKGSDVEITACHHRIPLDATANQAVAGLIGFFSAGEDGGVILLEPMASMVLPEKHVAFIADHWSQSVSYLVGFIGGIVLVILTPEGRRGLSGRGKRDASNIANGGSRPRKLRALDTFRFRYVPPFILRAASPISLPLDHFVKSVSVFFPMMASE